MSLRFASRQAAGQALARALLQRHLPPPHVVLALPRGGVLVATEVARALRAPLDLLLVRKIGAPGQPEAAVAAVVDGDPPETVIDLDNAAYAGLEPDEIEQTARREAWPELARRRALYLAGRAPLPLAGCTAIVVDDGVATGSTVRAALRALRRRGPARTVLAVPVAPVDVVQALTAEVDDLVCLLQPEPFVAVGRHFADFHQLDDTEVLAALAAQASPAAGVSPERR